MMIGRRDKDGSSQPSPDGPGDQRYDESFASSEVLLVDKVVSFRYRCSLTTGKDGQQDNGAEGEC